MNKKIVMLMAVLAGGLMMVACGSSKKSVSIANLACEWEIMEVNNQPVSAEQTPFLGFDVNKGQLYGNAGCNSLMASFGISKSANELSFDAIGSTKRMCRDMATEDAVLQALGAVKSFALDGDKLTLNDADGRELLELKKRP